MEKEQRFKIIELPTHQVMVMKDWDEEDSTPRVLVIIFIDGVKFQPSFGYKTNSEMAKAFDKIDSSMAQQMLDGAISMLK